MLNNICIVVPPLTNYVEICISWFQLEEYCFQFYTFVGVSSFYVSLHLVGWYVMLCWFVSVEICSCCIQSPGIPPRHRHCIGPIPGRLYVRLGVG
jgi:hypothetical protein